MSCIHTHFKTQPSVPGILTGINVGEQHSERTATIREFAVQANLPDEATCDHAVPKQWKEPWDDPADDVSTSTALLDFDVPEDWEDHELATDDENYDESYDESFDESSSTASGGTLIEACPTLRELDAEIARRGKKDLTHADRAKVGLIALEIADFFRHRRPFNLKCTKIVDVMTRIDIISSSLESLEVRAHIFQNASETVAHNHGMRFISCCLQGSYEHRVHKLVDEDEEAASHWQVARAQGSGETAEPQQCPGDLACVLVHEHAEGQELFIGPEVYHSVHANGDEDEERPLVTLTFRSKARAGKPVLFKVQDKEDFKNMRTEVLGSIGEEEEEEKLLCVLSGAFKNFRELKRGHVEVEGMEDGEEEKEKEEEEENGESKPYCLVCREDLEMCAKFTPCQHLVCCIGCVEALKARWLSGQLDNLICPLCRVPFEGYEVILRPEDFKYEKEYVADPSRFIPNPPEDAHRDYGSDLYSYYSDLEEVEDSEEEEEDYSEEGEGEGEGEEYVSPSPTFPPRPRTYSDHWPPLGS